MNPAIEKFIVNETKKNAITDEKEVNNLIDFFVVNLISPMEKDRFTLECISQENQLYLGLTNFGKEAQLYLHHDQDKHILHIMPMGFSEFSRNCLLVYLVNGEFFPYFGQNLNKKLKEKAIIHYMLNQDNESQFAPLTLCVNGQAYQFKEGNETLLDKEFL